MESLENSAACFMDDLLDFSSDIGEEDEEDNKPTTKLPSSSSTTHSNNPEDPTRLFPEDCEEEELEWLSNKDAFPTVDTFVDLTFINPSNALKHESPISVLENSHSSFSSNGMNNSRAIMTSCCSGGGLAPPVRRPRSRRGLKRRRGGYADIPCQQWFLWCNNNQLSNKKEKSGKTRVTVPKPCPVASIAVGRKCQHCGAEKTPQWRAGPMGPKTLCNACGVRYKSGRLCAEYRPASSPTFSSLLHSNSHRKIMEMKMKRLKQSSVMVNPVDTG